MVEIHQRKGSELTAEDAKGTQRKDVYAVPCQFSLRFSASSAVD